jgi:AbrB family looped-hinge helix DNA binding protein
MSTISKDSTKRKVFPKGQVVIPVSLRRKYHIKIGDKIDVIPTQEGILLKSAPNGTYKGSLTGRLYGVFADYASKRPDPSKADLSKANEQGFIEGWME